MLLLSKGRILLISLKTKIMNNTKKIEWILRIAVAGEFIGHGVFALQNKQGWHKYFDFFGISDPAMIKNMLLFVGLMDILLAIIILTRPIRIAVLWMVFWGLFTALIRWPLGPDPFWDFVERWTNWGAPLALFFILGGMPKTLKDWFK